MSFLFIFKGMKEEGYPGKEGRGRALEYAPIDRLDDYFVI